MPVHVFESVEEMLAPRALKNLGGGGVGAVARVPLDAEHFSGNTLERVYVEQSTAPLALVLKRFRPERDWVMRLTHDTRVREAMLFRHGVFRRLPASCVVPIIAVARDGTSWATLMRDVSDALVVSIQPILDASVVEVWLEHLAALHAQFWNDATLDDPQLGLSSLHDFVTILSPRVVRREVEAGRAHFVLEAAARGWKIFDTLAPAEVLEIVHRWQDDPAPLLDALEKMPHTLLHGDFKAANLGLVIHADAPRTVLLDWQDATCGPAFLDLGYFLAVNARRMRFSHDEAVERYSHALRTRGISFTARERDLALLAGGALRLFWQMALGAQSEDKAVRIRAQNDLNWWYDLVRRVGARI